MLNINDVIQLDTEIYTEFKQNIFLSKVSILVSFLSSAHLSPFNAFVYSVYSLFLFIPF